MNEEAWPTGGCCAKNKQTNKQARRSSPSLSHYLKVAITATVRLAAVIDCQTSPTRGERRKAAGESGRSLLVKHEYKHAVQILLQNIFHACSLDGIHTGTHTHARTHTHKHTHTHTHTYIYIYIYQGKVLQHVLYKNYT